MGAELFDAGGQTNHRGEASSRFSKFCERAWKRRSSLLMVGMCLCYSKFRDAFATVYFGVIDVLN